MIWSKLPESIINSPAKRDKVVIINLILGLLVNIAVWAVLIFAFGRSSEYIILRYNIYFGISSLGPWYNVLALPLWGLVAIIVNLLIGFRLYLRQKLLAYLLSFTAVISNVIILAATFFIYYINI